MSLARYVPTTRRKANRPSSDTQTLEATERGITIDYLEGQKGEKNDKETDKNYKYVIRQIKAARLITTACGMQYAIQTPNGARWANRKFLSRMENVAEACEQLGIEDLSEGLSARI